MRKQEEKNGLSDTILVADYGRSGQGWLSYMLCYVLNARFIEPYDFLKGRRYTKSTHVLSLTQGRLHGRKTSPYSMIVKTHEYPAADFGLTDKVIYLLRDPRDVAVSGYFRARTLRAQGVRRSVKARLIDIIARFRFANLLLTYVRWRKHVNAWERIPRLTVRYEDLNMRTEEVLWEIMRYLKVKPNPKTVREAVAQFSFERITGRSKGTEDQKNPEFRKGVIGDHKNHFSPLELRIFWLLCDAETKALILSGKAT